MNRGWRWMAARDGTAGLPRPAAGRSQVLKAGGGVFFEIGDDQGPACAHCWKSMAFPKWPSTGTTRDVNVSLSVVLNDLDSVKPKTPFFTSESSSASQRENR
jgi:hypothetical protein